MLLLFFI